jgi:hypothetical protein
VAALKSLEHKLHLAWLEDLRRGLTVLGAATDERKQDLFKEDFILTTASLQIMAGGTSHRSAVLCRLGKSNARAILNGVKRPVSTRKPDTFKAFSR